MGVRVRDFPLIVMLIFQMLSLNHEHDIKLVIQEWFRTASVSGRDGGRKRRMDRAQDQQDLAGVNN